MATLRAGNIQATEPLLRAILKSQPHHVGALNVLGIVLTRLGRFAEAESYLGRALREQPNSDVTLCNYGIVLKALNRPAEALAPLTQALAINSASAETWHIRGIVFNDLQRFSEAIGDFVQAIALNPRNAEAHLNKGKSLVGQKRLSDAASEFERAAALKPNLVEAWFACGNAYRDLKLYEEAIKAYDRAIALAPDWAAALNNRAAALVQVRRYGEALRSCDQAISLTPDLALPHFNRASALLYLHRYEEALASCSKAISLDLHYAEGWLVRGDILTELGQYDDALAAYERVGNLRPDLALTWLGRGNVFARLKQYELAFHAYDRATALDPDLAEAWHGRGNLLVDTKRYQEAFDAYEKALELKPDLAEAWSGSGKVFNELRRYDEALSAYSKALTLRSDLRYAAGNYLYVKLMLCDWRDLYAEVERLLTGIRNRKPLSLPFVLLAIQSSPADQFECAKRYVQDQPTFSPLWHGGIRSHDRFRVAYLSADFREHPVADLTVGLFENHDRSRFEVTGISIGSDQDSPMRRRLKAAFEHFLDVQEKTDEEVADLVRQLEIDILVDLAGHTEGSRLGVFGRRAAPIQVNYLGYAGTMGADYIDYLLADSTMVPEDQCEFYSEQVVWLPQSYLVYDNRRKVSERVPTRKECALPDRGFVYCCFNNAYKITPEIFDIWMRLLRAVDGSVLWLRKNDELASKNLCREAERRGVAPDRLVFADRAPLLADHLARHRQADLFLDTLPYNAHTTANDALSAGVPVLTCLGSTFAGRVAASLLRSAGLEELVASSLHEYERLALSFGRDASYLAAVKNKLERNRETFPLFDTERATHHIEAAYTMMWQRYQKGEMRGAPSDRSKPIRVS
jgi:protein O-GlcNAc transferase